MKSKQNVSLKTKVKQNIKDEILSLLDQDKITKTEILDHVQEEFKINNSDMRVILREIRTDFLKKLTVLQSGVVKV